MVATVSLAVKVVVVAMKSIVLVSVVLVLIEEGIEEVVVEAILVMEGEV